MKSKSSDITFQVPTPKFTGRWELTKLSVLTFFDCFWFIFKIVIPIYLPSEVLKTYLFPDAEKQFSQIHSYNNLMEIFFGTMLAPAVVYGVAHHLRSKTFPPVMEAYIFGIKKWFHLLGQQIIGGMILLVGLLFLIVPGIFVFISYSLIVPVVCFDGAGRKKWLKKSRELTIGSRKIIFIVSINLLLLTVLFVEAVKLTPNITEFLFNQTFNTNSIEYILENLLEYIFTVFTLLFYLKARKDRRKKPKEFWFLRWAR